MQTKRKLFFVFQEKFTLKNFMQYDRWQQRIVYKNPDVDIELLDTTMKLDISYHKKIDGRIEVKIHEPKAIYKPNLDIKFSRISSVAKTSKEKTMSFTFDDKIGYKPLFAVSVLDDEIINGDVILSLQILAKRSAKTDPNYAEILLQTNLPAEFKEEAPAPIPMPKPKIDIASAFDNSSPSDSDENDIDFSLDGNAPNYNCPFVGIKNQGATCYMNSVIQIFYHLPIFRKMIYKYKENDRVIEALQKLFAALQLSKKSQSTANLTRAFDWDSTDVSIQHDAQEFARIFTDRLHNSLGSAIDDLFMGTIERTVSCPSVNYVKTTKEDFYDLSLDVRSCHNIMESLSKYTGIEYLTGKNQYETDKYGRQDAEMVNKISKLPKILQLHLGRFEYDPGKGGMIKISSRFEYSSTIDVKDCVVDGIDCCTKYSLAGVIVHAGKSGSHGHYYSYSITPDGRWFLFNDTSVRESDENGAIESNFGGDDKYGIERSFCAYMLFYIRDDCRGDILCEISDDEIPNTAQPTVDMMVESQPEERTQILHIITEQMVAANAARGSVWLSDITETIDLKYTNAEDILTRISELIKCEKEELRLFSISHGTTMTEVTSTLSKLPKDKSLYFATTVKGPFVLLYYYFPKYDSPLRFAQILKVEDRCCSPKMLGVGIGIGETVHLVVSTIGPSGAPQDIDSMRPIMGQLGSIGAPVIFAPGNYLVHEYADPKEECKFSERTKNIFDCFLSEDHRYPNKVIKFLDHMRNPESCFVGTIDQPLKQIYFCRNVKQDGFCKYVAHVLGLDYDPLCDCLYVGSWRDNMAVQLSPSESVVASHGYEKRLFVHVIKGVHQSAAHNLVVLIVSVTRGAEVLHKPTAIPVGGDLSASELEIYLVKKFGLQAQVRLLRENADEVLIPCSPERAIKYQASRRFRIEVTQMGDDDIPLTVVVTKKESYQETGDVVRGPFFFAARRGETIQDLRARLEGFLNERMKGRSLIVNDFDRPRPLVEADDIASIAAIKMVRLEIEDNHIVERSLKIAH